MNFVSSKDRITSILFSDVKGFSNIRNDSQKTKLFEIIQGDMMRLLNDDNHFYQNSWGDAFFICSDSPALLAEIALQLRDKSRNRNWKGIGFSDDLAVRIGLHVQQVKVLLNPDGTIKNVVGSGVDTAARIEPVTEPNRVFCSNLFYEHLLNDQTHKIKGVSVGLKQLAKNYKEMELFELFWEAEAVNEAISSSLEKSRIPLPKIKRGFTDKQQVDYLYQAFDVLKSYFRAALNQLEASHSDIETAFRELDNTSFVCEIYQQGALKDKCKIWIGGSFGHNGIHYVVGRNAESSSGWNELIYVGSDESAMYLKFSLGDYLGGSTTDYRVHQATPDQIAEALWKRFTRTLEQ